MNILSQIQRSRVLLQQYKLRQLSKQPLSLQFQLPEKYKGTRIEKWYIYWRGLLQDYREVGKDTLKDIRLKPLKALTMFSGFVLAGFCKARNPDEQSFHDAVLRYDNDLILTGEATRNENSVNYMKFLMNSYNTDIIRYFSFGIFSIVWIANNDKSCGLYEAQCAYTKIPYLQFYKHVIDVGFWNNWWLLEHRMKDYDVNISEWYEEKEDTMLSTGLFYNFPLWPARDA